MAALDPSRVQRPGRATTLLAVAALVCALVVPTTSAAGAATVKNSQLSAVSCTSPSFCMAVGNSTVGSNPTIPLIERWNGKAWSIVASPKVPGALSAALHGVSCTSPTFCMAVGSKAVSSAAQGQSFAMRWNGHGWSNVATVNPAGERYVNLAGVTCVNTLRCFAVGNYLTGDGREPTFIQMWNGTKWATTPSPNPELGEGTTLSSVACAGASFCFAVGSNDQGGPGAPVTLALRWNGKSWTIVTTANPSKAYASLSAVSCASPTSCIAVGRYQTGRSRFDIDPPRTLVEHWNGKAWAIVASPTPGTTSELEAVSCTNAANCIGSGHYGTAGSVKPLVQHWNGATWVPATSGSPAGATTSALVGASCTMPTFCTTVGSRATGSGPSKTLTERGTVKVQSIVASPNP